MTPRSLSWMLSWRLLLAAVGIVAFETVLVLLEYSRAEPPPGPAQLFEEFIEHVAFAALPLFAVLAVAILWASHTAVRGLKRAAAAAEQIDFARPGRRLPADRLPQEAVALVDAVNRGLDRLEAAMADQRAFTAEVAHDLRTPLSVLRLAVEDLPPPARIRFESQIQAMSRRIDQLVTLAQIEATAAAPAAVDLGALAAETVGRMALFADDRGRALALDRTAGAIALGEAGAIEYALQNLIENAVKYAPGGSTVTVVAGPGPILSVQDQGPGIPESIRSSLLERFRRGRAAADGGAGLGLAIARRAAESVGGGIEIADAPGGGTCVSLRFAAAPPASCAPAPAPRGSKTAW